MSQRTRGEESSELKTTHNKQLISNIWNAQQNNKTAYPITKLESNYRVKLNTFVLVRCTRNNKTTIKKNSNTIN
jgi:hypothetical protein